MRRSAMLCAILTIFMAGVVHADAIKVVDRPTGVPSFLGYKPGEFIAVMNVGQRDIVAATAADGVARIGDDDFDKISERFEATRIRKQFQGSVRAPYSKSAELARYYKIKFEVGSLEDAMAAYAQHPMVEKVEPIGIHTMHAVPNDAFYDPYQWYHNQANDHDIDSPEAWDIQTGSSALILAILDSGTRYYHPDLGGVNASPGNPGASRGNMWINNSELNGSAGVDDDANGYTDDWIGYDFIDGVSNCWPGEDCFTKDNDPRDFNGHGTHTAGIMGMLTNDGYGMAGVAGGWGNGSQAVTGNGCKIMALRMGYSYNHPIYGEVGVVMMDAAAEAFYYAADNGASIASCSWGSSNSGGIGAAATYFLNSGGMIFVAAGNGGAEETPDYLNGRGDCISVSSTDQNDNGSSFTTYGTWVDICAPGTAIYSTYHDHNDPNTNYWASLGGTSMATPMTAAVGGLIWSQNPGWTAAQVEAQLYSSADNIDAFLSAQYIGKMGVGRINAHGAVNTGTPAPVAAFTGSPTSGCVPFNVNFTDQSTGSITSWSWNFGDGGTSTAASPSYSYTTAGSYTVTLTVTGPGGADGETKSNYIVAEEGPTAGFVGSPTSGDYPLNVTFTDQSSGATSYSWTFGDGGTSTAASPSYTYTTAGTFTVTQTVTNACGSDPLVRTNYITVTTPPCNLPVAEFTGSPTSGDFPLNVSFTDQSTNSPTSWSWTFGDGGTSTAQNPNYVYNAAGTYTVTLTATNSCGSDGETKTSYITVTTPSGSTVITYDDFEGGMGNYTDGGSDMSRYTGGTYSHQGIASADIQDNSGVASSFYHTSGYDVSGFADLEVEFWYYPRSMDNSNEDFWVQFWDGSVWRTVAEFAQGIHFQNNNFYNVTVSISGGSYNFPSDARLRFMCDASGNADDVYIDEIEWRGLGTPTPQPPVAEFSGTPTSGVEGMTVSFTDLSTQSPTSWSWTFGDGGTSTAQNPQYTYNTAGNYTVSLTATNAQGSDGETKVGYITVTEPGTGSWTTITYDSFESNFGNYQDGGRDCSRYTGGTYAWLGNAAIDIQDNSGTGSSFFHSSGHDVSGYNYAEVEFTFIGVSMEVNEDFWVQYFNGSSWVTLATFARGVDFDNNIFYTAVVSWNSGSVAFPSNAQLRFRCDASGNNDDVYIDDVEWRGSPTPVTGAGEPIVLTAQRTLDVLPVEFELAQNFPNPFNPTTSMAFTLPEAGHVTLEVFNISGQRVAILADREFSAGRHEVSWNARNNSSGVYFYRIRTEDVVQTRKMILMK